MAAMEGRAHRVVRICGTPLPPEGLRPSTLGQVAAVGGRRERPVDETGTGFRDGMSSANGRNDHLLGGRRDVEGELAQVHRGAHLVEEEALHRVNLVHHEEGAGKASESLLRSVFGLVAAAAGIKLLLEYFRLI